MIVGLISSNYYPPSPTITLSPATLTTPTYGAYYSANIVASGGFAPYTYSVSSGTLPPGLTLNSSTGALTGYSGTGSFSFVIRATDRAGYYAEQSYAFELYNKTATIDYLIVAGGGGGGGSFNGTESGAGGGGGGGYLYGTLSLGSISTLSLGIGAGGTGGDQGQTNALAGGNSSISGTGLTTLTAIGGGLGARGSSNGVSLNGGAGGSGGGASSATSSSRGTGGSATSGQGFAGGQGAVSATSSSGGGGGGGAGGAGGSSGTGGAGGAVGTKVVAGSNFTFSGGGAGGYTTSISAGSVAIGYGTGGQGARRSFSGGLTREKGQSGAPGVIILWYPNTYDQLVNLTGAYTYENVGGYHKYTITSVGTSSVTI